MAIPAASAAVAVSPETLMQKCWRGSRDCSYIERPSVYHRNIVHFFNGFIHCISIFGMIISRPLFNRPGTN